MSSDLLRLLLLLLLLRIVCRAGVVAVRTFPAA
jgi:hypothetical protein